jgi:hypothetical protein
LSPILPQDALPFTIRIEQSSLLLPNGIHSGASATHKGKWLLLAGRTNGLHGFNNSDDNFPPQLQNTVAYVVDYDKKIVYARALNDPSSGLSQVQIDQLSVTSPQYFQKGKTLYISGGYGVDTGTGTFGTKDTLTALNIPKFMQWVIQPSTKNSPSRYIRQTADPLLQVSGGYMDRSHGFTLLIFGQNFSGFYLDSSNGNYTQQVRRFKIVDNGKQLTIKDVKVFPADPNYRRRDLNVVPVVQGKKKAFVALSGVFTPSDTGVWTVPVTIKSNGSASMADPSLSTTFKQGMNNYVCATAGLYDHSKKNMYILLLGGISFGFFQNGAFTTDSEIPFINEVTTIKIDKKGNFTQYLMDNQYPVIPSTQSNPGNTLLFGAGAEFFSAENVPAYSNGVFSLNAIKSPVVLGYIVGGIMSTVPNTSDSLIDSAASPYIFRVILEPKK